MEEPEVCAAPRAQHENCPSGPSGAWAGEPPQQGGELVDSALLHEIGLLSEVITTVALYSGHLTDDEINDVLGVDEQRRQGQGRRPRTQPRASSA